MIEINEQILTGIMIAGFIVVVALLITILVFIINHNKNHNVQRKNDPIQISNSGTTMKSQCYKKNNSQPYNWSIDQEINSETECINKILNCPNKWDPRVSYVRECEKNNTCSDATQKCYIWDNQETISLLQK